MPLKVDFLICSGIYAIYIYQATFYSLLFVLFASICSKRGWERTVRSCPFDVSITGAWVTIPSPLLLRNLGIFVLSIIPKFTQLCRWSSLSCMKVCLVIGSCGKMSRNSLRAIIATWLNASQRSRVGVGMKMSARREGSVSSLCGQNAWILRYIRTDLYLVLTWSHVFQAGVKNRRIFKSMPRWICTRPFTPAYSQVPRGTHQWQHTSMTAYMSATIIALPVAGANVSQPCTTITCDVS